MKIELTPHEQAALHAGNLSLILRPVEFHDNPYLAVRVLPISKPGGICFEIPGVQSVTSKRCPLGQPGDVLAVDGRALRVVSVRCLRVQELSDADVLATGHIEGRTLGAPLRARMRNLLHYQHMRKEDDPDWSDNPYVWAVSVEVVT